jgi:hypothetical protein
MTWRLAIFKLGLAPFAFGCRRPGEPEFRDGRPHSSVEERRRLVAEVSNKVSVRKSTVACARVRSKREPVQPQGIGRRLSILG